VAHGSVERVVANFVARYGRDRLQELLNALTAGESGQHIADQFGVSRERVRQWKNTFGTEVVFYRVHHEVIAAVEELPRST